MKEKTIEVEGKFELTEEQKSKLIEGAKLTKKVRNYDTYYDFPDFRYFKKGIRLRVRREKIKGETEQRIQVKVELKKPNLKRGNTRTKEETEDETEILTILGLEKGKTNGSLKKFIKKKMQELCTVITKRKTYEKDGFTIDIDSTSSGFKVCEIELMVNDEREIPEADNKIVEFVESFGLKFDPNLRGKVAHELAKNKPEIYEQLYTQPKIDNNSGIEKIKMR